MVAYMLQIVLTKDLFELNKSRIDTGRCVYFKFGETYYSQQF